MMCSSDANNLFQNLLYKLKTMLMSNEELILAFHELKLNLQVWNIKSIADVNL